MCTSRKKGVVRSAVFNRSFVLCVGFL